MTYNVYIYIYTTNSELLHYIKLIYQQINSNKLCKGTRHIIERFLIYLKSVFSIIIK